MTNNRLKELRLQHGYTLDDIEKKTGIKRGTYSNYENNNTEPKLETWRKLAKFYDVPAPYLQGITFSKYDIYKILNDEYLKNSLVTVSVTGYLIYVKVSSPDSLFSKDEMINFDKKVQKYWEKNFSFIFSYKAIAILLYMDKRSNYPYKINERLSNVISKETRNITRPPINKAFKDIISSNNYSLIRFFRNWDEITRNDSKENINKYVDEAIKELTEFKKALKDLPDNKQ